MQRSKTAAALVATGGNARPIQTVLLNAASVGDTIRIADVACLFRSVVDILALRLVLIRCGLHQ